MIPSVTLSKYFEKNEEQGGQQCSSSLSFTCWILRVFSVLKLYFKKQFSDPLLRFLYVCVIKFILGFLTLNDNPKSKIFVFSFFEFLNYRCLYFQLTSILDFFEN